MRFPPLLVTAMLAVSPYTHIYFDWRYTPNLPVCGAVLKSCFVGFRMVDQLSGSTLVKLSPTARSWNYVPAGGVQYGKHTFELRAVGYDANGVFTRSAPNSIIVDVVAPPVSPAGLTAALQ